MMLQRVLLQLQGSGIDGVGLKPLRIRSSIHCHAALTSLECGSGAPFWRDPLGGVNPGRRRTSAPQASLGMLIFGKGSAS